MSDIVAELLKLATDEMLYDGTGHGDPTCLAAADEIERLRAALTAISEIADQPDGGDWDEIEDARRIARKALATKDT